MSHHMKHLAAWSASVVAAAILSVAVVGAVGASHVIVRIGVPGTLEVGTLTYIPVALTAADGTPLPGTPVTFFLDASFAGVSGEVEVGAAVTDGDGVATLAYLPRVTGHHEIRMTYTPAGASEPEIATIPLDVTGATQLYASDPGLSIPGINVTLLMAILTTVWGILFGVSIVIIRIARAGREPGREASAG